MNSKDVIAEVQEAFSGLPRPKMFTRGTCKCEECLEHEETMKSLNPENIALDKVDNPGWDPICFASDEAFAYLIPGLVKIVINHTEDYVQQFMFHFDNSDRISILNKKQIQSLLLVLDYLAVECAEIMENNIEVEELDSIRQKLRKHLSGSV